MKTKTYGHSKYNDYRTISYAIVVPYVIPGTDYTTWQFVTKIETYPHRIWQCENHKRAKLFSNKKDAQQFIIELAYRGFAGFPVEVMDGMEDTLTNNWEEKK